MSIDCDAYLLILVVEYRVEVSEKHVAEDEKLKIGHFRRHNDSHDAAAGVRFVKIGCIDQV